MRNVEGDDGWNEYSKLVLGALDRQDTSLKELRESVVHLREQVAALKVTAGGWGLIGGVIPAVGALIYMLIK